MQKPLLYLAPCEAGYKMLFPSVKRWLELGCTIIYQKYVIDAGRLDSQEGPRMELKSKVSGPGKSP